MSKSYKQTKQEYFDRRKDELHSQGKGVDCGRLNREWSNSKERVDKLFEGVRTDQPTSYESNFQDYDNVG